ncbi:MAG: serine/threonine-protein kinase [Synechococcales bacterium]|nr:serine/threonine-protein kinase [Synechococcales bacterium]
MVKSRIPNSASGPRPAPYPRNPSLLGGRYRVVKRLAEGSFGQTSLAQDLHLPDHPLCVVKQLKAQADGAAMRTARRLFELEARVLYRLGIHSQIPRLLAHFEEGREFYLTQEYIDGRSLSDELIPGQPWAEARVIALLEEILAILTFVHHERVIHRDIKPGNLIRRHQDGKVVMIDFGAVKQVSTQFLNPKPGQTDYTIAIGTLGYIPKEQIGGRPRYSSDVYAVGMIGIQALTGISPQRLLEDEQSGEIRWRDRAPQVSPELAQVLDCMVRYDYRDRYPSAQEALAALQHLPPHVRQPLVATHLTDLSTPEGQSPPTSAEVLLPTAGGAPQSAPGLVTALGGRKFQGFVGRRSLVPAGDAWGVAGSSPSGWQSLLGTAWHQCQDWAMGAAVAIRARQKSIPVWYVVAVLGAIGVLSVVNREILVSPQNRLIKSAHRVSEHAILKPAEELVSRLPQNTPLTGNTAMQTAAYLNQAERLEAVGDYQAALEFYRKVLALDGNRLAALQGRCASLNALNQPELAIDACHDLLAIFPDDVVGLWGLGVANHQMELYDKAMELFDRAIAINPEYAPAWKGRGDTLQQVGRLGEANASFNRALELAPDPERSGESSGDNELNQATAGGS